MAISRSLFHGNLPDVVGRGDGGLAAGHLPQGHHVVRGQTLVTGTNAVHRCHLNRFSVKLSPCSHPTHLERVDSEGRQVSDIVASLCWGGGDHLVVTPVCLLALPDVDDVVADLGEVDMQRRGPGELHTARVKLHDQGLTRSARDIWKCTVSEIKPGCKLESFLIKLNASQTFPRTYELNHFMLTET